MSKILFAGDPEGFGGLSNEKELAKACPPEFKRGNPWSDYASRCFFSGARISNWKWKTEDAEQKRKQKGCFVAVISGFGLSHEDKEAVAGWMLSEMLTEVPVWESAKGGAK